MQTTDDGVKQQDTTPFVVKSPSHFVRAPFDDAIPSFGSSALPVLNNKVKVVRAGLLRQRTPTQCVRDDFLGKHPPMPFCSGFLADQHNG